LSADCRNLARHDAFRDKVVASHAGTTLTKRRIVFLSSALVAITRDPNIVLLADMPAEPPPSVMKKLA
jgi:hypothetical protein